MNSHRVFLLLSVIGVILARPAAADPISVVTGGYVETNFNRGLNTTFELHTRRFTAMGELPEDESFGMTLEFFQPPTPYQIAEPGVEVNLSSHMSFHAYDTSQGGLGALIYEADFRFEAETVPLDNALVATSPFLATGTLNVTDDEGSVLSVFPWVGRGRATLSYNGPTCDPPVPLPECPPQLSFLTYSFETAPTPEPGTWLLFVTGASVLGSRLRRKGSHADG